MLHSHAVRTALLVLFAAGAVGCNLQVDQIFQMKDGSGVDTFLVSKDGTFEIPQGRLEFQGGTVMRIHISTSLLDYLDGTVDGTVELLDLLFAIPNLHFLISDVGLICVVLDDPKGGGTFQYNVLAQQATFDVQVNSKALITNQVFRNSVKDGLFLFPFHLQSTIPLSLLDALGLFTGTGSLEVTQHLDQRFTVLVKASPTSTTDFIPFIIGIRGDVTLDTTDTFPATPKVLQCVDFLAGQGT
jgi:hypothetical protein